MPDTAEAIQIETPPPPDGDAAEYAVVEVFGHRRHAGRIQEVERFGTKLLRIDVPKDGEFERGYLTHFYGGASIFSLIPADLETVKKLNEPYRPVGRLAPPADDRDDDPEQPF